MPRHRPDYYVRGYKRAYELDMKQVDVHILSF
jgi:hypothetical protein